MYFKVRDYENEEWLIEDKTNLDGIVGEINVIYAYEEGFKDITMAELGEFLINAHLLLVPVL